MESQDYILREQRSFLQTYKRYKIVIREARGARVFTEDGEEYLDFLAGIAVNALGHCHPAVMQAVGEQLGKYMHVSNYFYQPAQINFVETLLRLSGFDRAFLTNSGTEATEGAMKLARKWGSENGKSIIYGFTGGFHGRTYGALSIMDKPQYKLGMGPFLENCGVLPHNNVAALREKVNENTAALFLEFVQGEGGLTVAEPEFIRAIKELKEKYGFLLVADEIQAGTGRTGKFNAFDHYGIKPDIAISAKGLGGGLPLGAILVRENLAGVWSTGEHGTTYGGNALACAAGGAVLKELEAGLLEKVDENGRYFGEQLEEIAREFPTLVEEARGLGLMRGLKLKFDAGALVAELLSRHVLTNAASGTVLRIVPPLIITREDIDLFCDRLRDALTAVVIPQ